MNQGIPQTQSPTTNEDRYINSLEKTQYIPGHQTTNYHSNSNNLSHRSNGQSSEPPGIGRIDKDADYQKPALAFNAQQEELVTKPFGEAILPKFQNDWQNNHEDEHLQPNHGNTSRSSVLYSSNMNPLLKYDSANQSPATREEINSFPVDEPVLQLSGNTIPSQPARNANPQADNQRNQYIAVLPTEGCLPNKLSYAMENRRSLPNEPLHDSIINEESQITEPDPADTEITTKSIEDTLLPNRSQTFLSQPAGVDNVSTGGIISNINDHINYLTTNNGNAPSISQAEEPKKYRHTISGNTPQNAPLFSDDKTSSCYPDSSSDTSGVNLSPIKEPDPVNVELTTNSIENTLIPLTHESKDPILETVENRIQDRSMSLKNDLIGEQKPSGPSLMIVNELNPTHQTLSTESSIHDSNHHNQVRKFTNNSSIQDVHTKEIHAPSTEISVVPTQELDIDRNSEAKKQRLQEEICDVVPPVVNPSFNTNDSELTMNPIIAFAAAKANQTEPIIDSLPTQSEKAVQKGATEPLTMVDTKPIDEINIHKNSQAKKLELEEEICDVVPPVVNPIFNANDSELTMNPIIAFATANKSSAKPVISIYPDENEKAATRNVHKEELVIPHQLLTSGQEQYQNPLDQIDAQRNPLVQCNEEISLPATQLEFDRIPVQHQFVPGSYPNYNSPQTYESGMETATLPDKAVGNERVSVIREGPITIRSVEVSVPDESQYLPGAFPDNSQCYNPYKDTLEEMMKDVRENTLDQHDGLNRSTSKDEPKGALSEFSKTFTVDRREKMKLRSQENNQYTPQTDTGENKQMINAMLTATTGSDLSNQPGLSHDSDSSLSESSGPNTNSHGDHEIQHPEEASSFIAIGDIVTGKIQSGLGTIARSRRLKQQGKILEDEGKQVLEAKKRNSISS